MGMRTIFTDESITPQEWDMLAGLALPSNLIRLIDFLRSRNGEAVPVKELPDFFCGSHPEQLNQQLSQFDLLYRLGGAEGKSYLSVPYYERSLKLYKVKPKDPRIVRRLHSIWLQAKDAQARGSVTETVRLMFPVGHASPTEINLKAAISMGPNGGYIHLYPSRSEVDEIIGYLQEIRSKITE